MNSSDSSSRRQLLLTVLPAGAAAGLGCKGLALCAAQAGTQARALRSGEKVEMTWQEVFDFSFKRRFIPVMKKLAAQVGRERFVGMLRKASLDAEAEEVARIARQEAQRDLAAWVAPLKSKTSFLEHGLVCDIVEDTPKAVEVRISQCLWAKTFREMDASDIGYATICHCDHAVSAFNPKLKLVRTKTLMQGHDCCNHRFVMEG